MLFFILLLFPVPCSRSLMMLSSISSAAVFRAIIMPAMSPSMYMTIMLPASRMNSSDRSLGIGSMYCLVATENVNMISNQSMW